MTPISPRCFCGLLTSFKTIRFRQYAPADTTLKRLEAEARTAKAGLWADPKPIPPWEWRRGGGTPTVPAGTVLGNRNSKVYHRLTCPNAAKIAERNRASFPTDAAAKEAGYRPGRCCFK